MDSTELDCLIRKNDAVARHYGGGEIFCIDDLPHVLKPGKFYIFNAMTRKEAAESIGHWLILLCYKRKIVYVDSLGLQPSCPVLKILLNCQLATGVDIFYSNVVLQANITTTCGLHATVFATLFSLDYNIYEIFFEFYKIQNYHNVMFYYDHFAAQFVSRYYHEKCRSIFYSF